MAKWMGFGAMMVKSMLVLSAPPRLKGGQDQCKNDYLRKLPGFTTRHDIQNTMYVPFKLTFPHISSVGALGAIPFLLKWPSHARQ